jgi:hypothetical protein
VAEGGGNGGRDDGREWSVKPWVDKTVAVVRTWPARQRHCSDRAADERGPHGFVFSQIIQSDSNLEIKNGCFTML